MSRYDCCPPGAHREDELCSRTGARSLPPADESEPEASQGDDVSIDNLLADIKTIPPVPLKLPDMAQLILLADRARALRPEGDRLVMASPMYEIVKGFSRPAPQQYGGLLSGMSYGIPIVLDEDMPDNVIELRDGDRVVKRIEYGAAPAEEAR